MIFPTSTINHRFFQFTVKSDSVVATSEISENLEEIVEFDVWTFSQFDTINFNN